MFFLETLKLRRQDAKAAVLKVELKRKRSGRGEASLFMVFNVQCTLARAEVTRQARLTNIRLPGMGMTSVGQVSVVDYAGVGMLLARRQTA